MSVPELLVLTDRHRTVGRELTEVVRAALDGGAPVIVLREKDLARSDRARLADMLRPLVVDAGARFLVASDPTMAGEGAGGGVHLAAADPFPIGWSDDRGLVGRSCHTDAELRAAAAEGCTYATISPVFVSASKPGYGPALGVEELGRAARAVVPFPVLALGGVTSANALECRRAGAHGVAVMGAVMEADDPAVTVRDLLAALHTPAVDERMPA